MFDDSRSFISRAFLRAEFDLDYRAYTDERDAELLRRLRDWDGRLHLTAGPLAEAYWRWLLLRGPAREAERFAADLRRPPAPSDAPAASQFIERVAALAAEVSAIETDERALNEILYGLYGLSPDERNLVENEPGRRNSAPVGG